MQTKIRTTSGKTRWALRPIAGTCALVFSGGAAYAQEAQLPAQQQAQTAQQLDTIEVSGIRSSIETSINIKRNSDSIVESITAEDIGKLPDTSIADSIARLPGLTAQRVDGRAQQIAIRGFAPDFAVSLLNGREMVSIDNNRGVQYDQFPSELMHGVTVYKTPDASLAALGLSGTIDMSTVHPLDLKERTIAVNARGDHNSLGALNPESKANGGRFSISYIDQFADHKVGLAIGFAHLDSPGQEKHFASWGYDVVGNACLDNNVNCQNNGVPFVGPVNSTLAANPNALINAGSEISVLSRDQVRDGLMASLEFKPNDNVHSTLDLYYSKFNKKEYNRTLQWSSDPGWWDFSNMTNPTITNVAGNLPMVTSGTLTDVTPVLQTNYNSEQDKLYAFGWNNRYKTNGWLLDTDVSYSRAHRQEDWNEMYAGLSNGTSVIYPPPATGIPVAASDTINFQLPFGSGFPTFTTNTNWADPNKIYLTDPAAWGWGQDGFRRYQTMDDHLTALKLSAHHSLSGIFDGVDFGANYDDRTKTRTAVGTQYFLQSGGGSGGDTGISSAPSQYVLAPTSLGFAGIPAVMSYNVLGLLNDSNLYYSQRDTTQIQYDYLRNWQVNEKALTAFGKLGISTNLGKIPVHGNLGLQIVHTNQSSTGAANNNTSTVTRGTTYDNVLPSLNLNLDLNSISTLTHETILRLGVARTMARPAMDDMRGGFSGSVDRTAKTWSGDAGNPLLKPWIADGYDISAEKYFGKGSYVAVAGFYKALRNYIYNQTIPFDFTGFPNPTGVNPICQISQPNCNPNVGLLTEPTNGQGGVVHGIEISGSLEGRLIHHLLDGFGLQASASNTISNINPNLYTVSRSGTPVPIGYQASLPGLSGLVSSWTVYYEKNGFEARFAQRYRSSFLGSTPGPHGFFVTTEIMPERISDAQISYEFQKGTLKGVSLLLQVDNLTNTPYRTRLASTATGGISGYSNAPEQYNTYGRDVLFGINYKL